MSILRKNNQIGIWAIAQVKSHIHHNIGFLVAHFYTSFFLLFYHIYLYSHFCSHKHFNGNVFRHKLPMIDSVKIHLISGNAVKVIKHMGAEPKNSFKGGPRDPLYGILTTRHHRLRDYVSPNQSCKVFGDFGQKS